MASNNNFTLNGATPNFGYTPPLKSGQSAFSAAPNNPLSTGSSVFGGSLPSSTPAATALKKADPNANFQTLTGAKVAMPTYPANMNYNTEPPKPTTPVKKTTTNNVDGSSHTTEYHAPSSPPTPGVLGSSSTQQTDGSYTLGNTQTNTQTPPSQNTEAPLTYPGLLGKLVSATDNNATIGKSAADIAADYGKKIADVGGQGARAQAGYLTTGTSPVGEGNAAVTAQTTAAQQQALAAGESAALLGTGQQLTAQNQTQSGINNAASLAQPIQVPYSNQLLNPTNGQPIGGGSAGALPPAAQSAVDLQIQKVKSGNSTVSDALSALSAYGQAGVNALQQGLGPSFSNIQSNANAASQATNLQNTSSQAQATQQSVAYANKVLDDLTTAYNAQGSLQKTGIPLINAGATLLSQLSGFGISATQGYTSATGEAVAAVSQALASGGITPSAAGQIATTLIPPNATPAQINTAKSYLQTFLAQRQETYTTPPSAAQYGGSNVNSNANTNPAGWF